MSARTLAAIGLLLSACAASSETAKPAALPRGAEAISVQGEALYPPTLSPEDQAKLETELADAKVEWEARPDDTFALIAYGRRLGSASRFQDAIRVFTDGIARHPDDARMYRFRGHRYISVREFDRARADLERAAKLAEHLPDEPEPGVKPNARGIVIDTLKLNIHYHLALAHYLQGDFDGAVPEWRECLRYAANPDSTCMATYWLAMTLARTGHEAEARPLLDRIRADFDIVEYFSYHKLCLVYKGELDGDKLLESTPPDEKTAIDFATIGYGVGTWHLAQGHRDRALATYRQVAHSEAWQAFGRIAAEVDLARLESNAR
jgi:tetratricopeptide (TPR) repeat protein